jgi:hypothetical protein
MLRSLANYGGYVTIRWKLVERLISSLYVIPYSLLSKFAGVIIT